VLLLASLIGCRERPSEGAQVERVLAGPKARTAQTPSPVIDLLRIAPDCDLEHRGLVLELGETGSEARDRFSFAKPPLWPRVTHGGTTYARIDQRRASFEFWVDAPLTVRTLTALARPGGVDRAAVTIDQHRVTTLRPGPSPEVSVSKIREITLAPGPHRLTLDLPGRSDTARTFDVAWIRLGGPSDDPSDLPPARRDVLREVDVGGDQRPAVVLRSGGAFRCAVWVPKGARVRTEIGLWGTGSGGAELAAIDSGARTVLSSYLLDSKEEQPAWRAVDLDLGAYGGRAVELELRATGVTSGTRLAFAGPRVVVPDVPEATIPRAKRAIVITLSGLLREHRPATFAEYGLPSLASFARAATFYPEYRNATTSVLGVMASVLTGLEPWQHGVSEDTDRLPQSRPTFAETLAAGGGEAGFFSGVPLSFEGFGLGRGFERYVSISPAEDRSATDPLDEAQAWLGAHQADEGAVLAIVHLRGAHPPFDIDRDRTRGLPPKEYGGDLDARRAAIQLADIRARRPVARQQMPEEDWQRLESLRRAALLDLDARLARFFTWLGATFADDSTLLIVMGDVPAGERPHIPYEENAPLSEEYLRSLLLVQHPGGHLSGQTLSGLFTTTDITHTLGRSLDVELAPGSGALDLAHDQASTFAARRLQIAYRGGAYSALLGPMRLSGKDGQLPALCDISLDPSCSEDRRGRELTLLRALWAVARRRISPELERRPLAETREPEERLDNALIVWGLQR
jgi:hypothetical protein